MDLNQAPKFESGALISQDPASLYVKSAADLNNDQKRAIHKVRLFPKLLDFYFFPHGKSFFAFAYLYSAYFFHFLILFNLFLISFFSCFWTLQLHFSLILGNILCGNLSRGCCILHPWWKCNVGADSSSTGLCIDFGHARYW